MKLYCFFDTGVVTAQRCEIDDTPRVFRYYY